MFNKYSDWIPSITSIPDWATDLAEVSSQIRNAWLSEVAIRQKYRKYFTGDVFNDKVSSDDTDAPLLYPIGVNIVKMVCMTYADSIFGEWTKDVISFEPSQDLDDIDDNDRGAAKLLQNILRNSNANSIFWEVELERNIYGGSAIKISPSFNTPGHIKVSRIDINSFYPIWNPDDVDDLLEVFVIIPMTPDQARLQWKIKSTADIIYRIEHWTKDIYENIVDGKKIAAYSGSNPWGVVPFVYIPRFRLHHWWGESAVEDIIPVQDELNMRLADVGEAINYNTHPIRWGFNLPKAFNSDNYPIGPNILWDLGRVIGNSPEPKLGILEANNPTPQGTFDFIKFVYDWARISSYLPPVSLGDEDGGGQRSGVTLEIKMAPIVRAIRRSRAYFSAGMIRMARIAATILKQKSFSDLSKESVNKILEGRLMPVYANLLPRDQAAIVDEVVKRLSTTPPTISLETAVTKLGDGSVEISRIKDMLKEYEDQFNKKPIGIQNPEEQVDTEQKKVPGMDAKVGVTKQKKQQGENIEK